MMVGGILVSVKGMNSNYEHIEEFLEHKNWLRRLACSLVGENEADDLVQDVFLKAVRHTPEIHGSTKGWLATVLRNRARMHFRTNSRRIRRNLAACQHEQEIPSPSENVDRHQRIRLLQQMVSALPTPYRTTLLGLYGEGYSAVDFANKHGLKPATVRQRHKHALKLLRQQFRVERMGAFRQLRSWFVTLLPAAASEMSSPLAFEIYELGLLAL